MSLSNTKIIVSADTVVGSTKVANYTSTINADTTEVTVTSRYVSSSLYDANKSTIESDRDNFVAYVREIQANLN